MRHPPAWRLLAFLAVILTSLGIVAAGAIATGRAAIVITHGVSMKPVYHQGDLVVVSRHASYAVGQIVAYRRAGHDGVVLHRLVAGDPRGWVFKGDNNLSVDPTHPVQGDLVGRAALHIPQGGVWLSRLTSPTALGLLAFALLAGGGGAATQTRRRRRRDMRTRPGARPRRTFPSPASVSPRLRAAAAVTAGAGALGLALGALAWTGPLETTATTATSSQRSMTFSYDASVAPSAAYDTTTVTAPEPVFRALTDTVDAHLTYRGGPGTIAVTAELSSPGGWHSTVPLATPVPVTDHSRPVTVRLDLRAIEARAAAAATVIGLPASPLTIALTAHVTPVSGPVFEPAVKLTLTPVQLALAGDASTLTVRDPVTGSRIDRVPRSLALLGHRLAVSTARTTAAGLLLGALLVAAALLLIGTRLTPTTEASRIQRRYDSLLVAVQPMPAPSGRQIIDVASFATLVKLAERYGLLILHWSRGGTATFLVQDEASTFRYRTGRGDDLPFDGDVTGWQGHEASDHSSSY